ncbi:MAG: hypothetical protein DSZ33_02140 [Gammaproteobacteria bacterium]|nr:MAG: hypothetical protein DSZ33_02140 [Gammaproteobacteria bacterium]
MFLLLIALFPTLLITSGATAAASTPLAEAVVYVDHGCADDDGLDQCLRIDWVKDQTFTWQWYQGEKQDNKPVSSVSKKDILETLEEIFGKENFDREKLDARLKDSDAIHDWFSNLMTADQAKLEARLALDPERVEIRAESPCSEKSVYSCPSRRIEFMAIGAAADSDMVTAGQPTASSETPGANSTANEAEPVKNDPPTSDEPSSSSTAEGWWLPGTLLALLAAGVGVLGFLVRKLLKRFASQQSLLKDLAGYTLDSLHNISLALNVDESQNAADTAAHFKHGKKGVATDGERLALAFSEILAPIVKDVATARLYLSLQDKLFHSTQDEQARVDLINLTRENLADFLPEVSDASTLEDMKTALENHEKKQAELRTASEQALRTSVDQLVKDQEDLTRQTQLAFNNLQKTISRLDSVVKANAEKH